MNIRSLQPRLILVAAMSVATVAVGAGCAVARDQQSVGSYVDDATLTARVKSKFAADKTVGAMSITVETMRGVVQLSGFAKSPEEKAAAENLARSTSGVRDVLNDIVVRA
ncbi:MAG: BON domain-containing protein [Burkholderiales bacterium]|nr:BON domain-containing protein [Burkholderiales bacterium]